MEGIEGFNQLEPSNQVAEVIAFIERDLPQFVTSHEFVHITALVKNEDQTTIAFCNFMGKQCNFEFTFERETPQYGGHKVDIGVRYGPMLIFTIEAKLLPTPKGSKKAPRQVYEYVYGHGGGIQRHKDGKHGLDDIKRPFPECGMIAYIRDSDFEHWFTSINRWIIDTNWPESEKLVKTYFSSCAKLESTHHRLDGNKLILHHFWVIVQNS